LFLLYFSTKVANMDFISHGLWGGVAFGRKNKKSFWLSFIFGIAPDVLAFGLFFAQRFLGSGNFFGGPPDPRIIPQYVYSIYSVTHSFLIFGTAFLLIWLIFKHPIWEMGAWGLHIALDIFTHSSRFFPTPFLWPLSDFKVNGIGWGSPVIFFPNVGVLAILYTWFLVYKKYYAKTP